MSYESPIEIVYGKLRTKIENEIYTVVQSYDIKVDKEELIKALKYDREQYDKGYSDAMNEMKQKGMMTNHEVACVLSELFDDPCACNYNGIDEWLSYKCELQDDCPNPVGVACWEQYLKYRGEKERE